MIHLQQYLFEYYSVKQKNGFFLQLIKNVDFSIPGVFIVNFILNFIVILLFLMLAKHRFKLSAKTKISSNKLWSC